LRREVLRASTLATLPEAATARIGPLTPFTSRILPAAGLPLQWKGSPTRRPHAACAGSVATSSHPAAARAATLATPRLTSLEERIASPRVRPAARRAHCSLASSEGWGENTRTALSWVSPSARRG